MGTLSVTPFIRTGMGGSKEYLNSHRGTMLKRYRRTFVNRKRNNRVRIITFQELTSEEAIGELKRFLTSPMGREFRRQLNSQLEFFPRPRPRPKLDDMIGE